MSHSRRSGDRLRARRSLAALAGVGLVVTLLSPTGSATAAGGDGARYERAVVAQINEARAAKGLGPVRVVPCPDEVAEARARTMLRTHRLARVGSRTMKQECSRPLRLNRSAITSMTPTALVRGWLRQRESRSVLLDRRVRWLGVGALADRSRRWHVSLLLVGRAQTSQPVSIEEAAPAGEATLTADTLLAEVEDLRAAIFRATNRRRAARDLPLLTESPCAAGFAVRHTSWMAEEGELAHGDLDRLRERCAVPGAAENIAAFRTSALDAKTVLKAWMDSPAHRANILDPGLDHLGVGVAFDASSGRWYTTQDFLRAD